MKQTDNIYSNPLQRVAAFSFDQQVVEVFPDMISRSVPGYETIVAMTGVLAGRYYQAGSVCYDLGCSLGASTFSMAQHLPAGAHIVGIDNSSAMIARCQQLLSQTETEIVVELRQADVTTSDIENASVVVLNFTLQFIELAQREALMRRIYDGMRPGGVLILSEKILFQDEHLQELNHELHHEFKRGNGYSDLEIAQKRTAIENVLIPETLAVHRARLANAGFARADVWFQCFNFASMVAVK